MKISKNILIILGVILFAIVFERGLSLTSLWERLELKTYDIRSKLAIDHGLFGANFKHADKRIVIVAIDDYSKEKLIENPELEVDSYPWTRDVWSEVVKFIEKGDPKAVLFDIVFDNLNKNPWNDKIFAQTLRKYDNIVLATNLSFPKSKFRKQPEKGLINKYSPTSTPLDVKVSGRRLDNAITYYSNSPVHKLYTGYNVMGVNNKTTDLDSTVRNYRPIYKLVKNDETYYMPSLAFAGFMKYAGEEGKITLIKNKLVYKNRAIAINKKGQTAINWHGRGNNYIQIPIAKVILSEENDRYLSPDFFKDKIVIIGRTDIKQPTAVNKFYSTPEINATALDNFINDGDLTNPMSRKFIHKMPFAQILILVVLSCALIAIIDIFVKNLLVGILSNLAFILLYIAACALVFAYPTIRLWVPIIIPVYYFIVTSIIIYSFRFQKILIKKASLANAFNKVVSPETLKNILEKQDLSILNSKRKNIAVLSCDIKNFSTFTEKNNPDQITNDFNEVLNLIVNTILESHGTINKIVDGKLTAYWGGIEEIKDAPYIAVETALEIKKRTSELKITNAKENKIIFDIQIGINSGKAVLGLFGSEKLTSYCALGEAVSDSWKVNNNCSELNRDILISKTTYEKTKDKILVLEAGKIEGEEVYEPVGLVENKN